MTDYTGYQEIRLNNEELAEFYSGKKFVNLKQNEYLILKDGDNEPIDYYKQCGAALVRVPYPIIKNDYSGQLKPRNPQQYCAFDMIQNPDIGIKLLTGTFGSFKTGLLCAYAVGQIEHGNYDKIIWIRNNVQVKDTDNLGALPGSELDKMLPYVMPLADHCGGVEGISRMIENGTLEVIPLGFLRGRDIRNSILLVDEGENLTRQHLQLIIGRVGDGSQLLIDADLRQRDRLSFEKSAGIELMIDRMAGHNRFGYVNMPKSERSEIAAMADLLEE